MKSDESSPGAGEPDIVLRGGWYTLWVAIVLALIVSIARQLLTLAAAPMATSLRLSDSDIGSIQGLSFALFSVTAVFLIAWAADRFDRRLVIGACLITCLLGAIACGFAQNFTQMFIAAIAVAAGDVGLTPIITSFVPELFKGRKRLFANGLFFFTSFLGVAIGLAFGGAAFGFLDTIHAQLPAVLQSFESWRLAFFLIALPTPLLLGLLAFTRLGRLSDHRPVEAVDLPQEPFLPFVRENGFSVATVIGALGLWAMSFTGYLVWLPVAATRLFGTTPAENGSAMGLATAIGVVCGVAIGTLSVRKLIVSMGPVATVRFFWITMLATVPVLIGFLFVRESWHLFSLLGLLMLASNAVGCMVYTVLQDMAPAMLRARMIGLWIAVYGIVAANAPTFIGWVSTALGTEPRILLVAMSAIGIPGWVGALVLFRLSEHRFVELVQHVAEREARCLPATAQAPDAPLSASRPSAT